ncbi:Uncharacterized protein SCF082_LOCUS16012 [Durusdinium trenchii]|uniref:Mediator of RNA polymerase II transcription subunit 11 n=1 Tax=Durusdinium trenchii TaxID=1381693 RepID=A0ABP0K9M6_9DINO
MAERWQTFSLPGAIRRAKTAMTGPSKMPSDPLEEQRAELLEMDRLISSLSACVAALEPQSALTILDRFTMPSATSCEAKTVACLLGPHVHSACVALAEQDHYEKKVERLKEQIAKGGSSCLRRFWLEGETGRSAVRRLRSVAVDCSVQPGRQVSEALENRWQEIGEADDQAQTGVEK